jgi:hypothetical protein
MPKRLVIVWRAGLGGALVALDGKAIRNRRLV